MTEVVSVLLRIREGLTNTSICNLLSSDIAVLNMFGQSMDKCELLFRTKVNSKEVVQFFVES